MPSKNALVDSVESEVRDLRQVYDLSHILFVFPYAKFEPDGEWSDASSLFSGLLAQLDTKQNIPFGRPVTLEVGARLYGLEVEVSNADSRRLANWGILTLRRRKKGLAISFSPRIRRLLACDTSFAVVAVPRYWDGYSTNIQIVEALQDTSRELSDVKLPRNYWLASPDDMLAELESTNDVGPHRNEVKLALLERQGWKCYNCGNSLKFGGSKIEHPFPKMWKSSLRLPTAPVRPTTIDHSLPRTASGSNSMSNYHAFCLECNQGKSNDLPHGLTAEDPRLNTFEKSEHLWLPKVAKGSSGTE